MAKSTEGASAWRSRSAPARPLPRPQMKAEMHWRHYQKIEAGENAPGFYALVRLKRALACTWDELFGPIQ